MAQLLLKSKGAWAGIVLFISSWVPMVALKWLYNAVSFLGNVEFIYLHREWLRMIARWLVDYELPVRLSVMCLGLAFVVYAIKSNKGKSGSTSGIDFSHEGPGFKREIRAAGDAQVYMRDATGETIAQRGEVRIVSTGPDDFISLKEAATRLYSEARAKKWPLAHAAETSSASGIRHGTMDDILDWMAANISIAVPIQGRRLPSTIHEEIPQEELKQMSFKAGGTELHEFFGQSPSYIDLKVKASDLNRHIDELAVKMRR